MWRIRNGEDLDISVIIKLKNKIGNKEIIKVVEIKNKLSFFQECELSVDYAGRTIEQALVYMEEVQAGDT